MRRINGIVAATIFVVVFVLAPAPAESGDRSFYQKREHSLAKPYNSLSGFGAGATTWDFGGDAMVTPNHVRLTGEKKGEKGYLWNRMETTFKNWEVHLHFRIKSEKSKSYAADGLAFWYTKDRMTPGDVFGSQNNFKGLGVFVDTFANDWNNEHKFPRISAMVSSGEASFDHDKDGFSTVLGGCQASLREKDYDTFLLVRYERRKLTIKHDVDNARTWRKCAEFDGVRLPSGFFFGVSAATGDLTDNHDVISLKVYEIESPGDDDKEVLDRTVGVDAPAAAAAAAHDDDRPRSEGGIVKWILLAFVVVLVAAVLVYYHNERRGSKRFY